jgi:hypothetical protein
MLPPESASAEQLSVEVGVGIETLERWRSEVQSRPARERVWTAAARLEAVIATAALDESQRSAWCREKGIYLKDLEQWRANASTALAQPEEVRASPQETRNDKKRIKQLEAELRRKDKALAEAAALLILAKKVEAIFRRDEDE